MSLNDAVARARLNGWELDHQSRGEARMIYIPQGMTASFHIVMIALTFVTCGVGILLYLPIWLFLELQTPPRQIMTITEVNGEIHEKVIMA